MNIRWRIRPKFSCTIIWLYFPTTLMCHLFDFSNRDQPKRSVIIILGVFLCFCSLCFNALLTVGTNSWTLTWTSLQHLTSKLLHPTCLCWRYIHDVQIKSSRRHWRAWRLGSTHNLWSISTGPKELLLFNQFLDLHVCLQTVGPRILDSNVVRHHGILLNSILFIHHHRRIQSLRGLSQS